MAVPGPQHHLPRRRPVRSAQALTLLRLTCSAVALFALSACARQYSVSVNQQVLYDPRPSSGLVRVADDGLQSCINLRTRTTEVDSVEDIDVLACPGLDIASLDGIRALSGLRFLDVAGNQLTTLDGLYGLPQLSSVNAPDNRLQDISSLLTLNTLTSAVLTGNPRIPCDQLDTLQARLGADLLRPEQCGLTHQ